MSRTMTAAQRRVLDYWRANPSATFKLIAEATGLSGASAAHTLLQSAHKHLAREAGEKFVPVTRGRRGIIQRPVHERILEKIEKRDGGFITPCWFWTGRTNHGGYAIFSIGPKRPSAHRAAYEIYVGPIPDGHQIDHLCRNRSCVNPAHLEAVTPRENVLRSTAPASITARNRARAAARTHCKRGHEFTPANTYWLPAGRRCRACDRLKSVAAYRRKRMQRPIADSDANAGAGSGERVVGLPNSVLHGEGPSA